MSIAGSFRYYGILVPRYEVWRFLGVPLNMVKNPVRACLDAGDVSMSSVTLTCCAVAASRDSMFTFHK